MRSTLALALRAAGALAALFGATSLALERGLIAGWERAGCIAALAAAAIALGSIASRAPGGKRRGARVAAVVGLALAIFVLGTLFLDLAMVRPLDPSDLVVGALSVVAGGIFVALGLVVAPARTAASAVER